MATAPPKAVQRFPRPKTVDEVTANYFNCILYGRPGAGKTTCAATAPPPLLFLDCDSGLLCLKGIPDEMAQKIGLNPKETFFEPIRSMDDMLQQIQRVARENAASPGYWNTVVVDNLTELQRVLLQDLLSTSERSIPTIQDWGVILLRMQKLVRLVRNLPCHTIFIAHEREDEHGIGPALSGRIEIELPGYVDLMARLTLVEREEDDAKGGKVVRTIRRLRCREAISQKVKAKSRSFRIGEWESPNLTGLIQKCHNP